MMKTYTLEEVIKDIEIFTGIVIRNDSESDAQNNVYLFKYTDIYNSLIDDPDVEVERIMRFINTAAQVPCGTVIPDEMKLLLYVVIVDDNKEYYTVHKKYTESNKENYDNIYMCLEEINFTDKVAIVDITNNLQIILTLV